MSRLFRRSPACVAALVVCLASAVAAQRPLSVTRLGDVKRYGPGIALATLTDVHVRITAPAYLVVLRVDPAGGIEPIFPPDTLGSPEYAPGTHIVSAPAPEPEGQNARLPDPVVRSADVLARGGQSVRPPAAGPSDIEGDIVAYWLVIVSDATTNATEVREILKTARLNFSSVRDELRALPRILVGGRATHWAAWFAPVN